MARKIQLLFSLALLLVAAWMGFPAFSVCHDNGGALLSCGLVGMLLGFVQVAIFMFALFVGLLINGVAHLFGPS
jgi:hypothetical protein